MFTAAKKITLESLFSVTGKAVKMKSRWVVK